MTCADNWWLLTLRGANTCPSSNCTTFEEWFSDGRGLCNTIWDNGYVYSEQEDNCTVFTFDPSMPNPNSRLSFPVPRAGVGKERSSVFVIGVLAIVLLSSV